MKIKTRLALALAVLVFGCGCSLSRSPSTPVNYYTLEYDPPRLEALDPLPEVLRVQRFSVAPEYNFLPIVYRDKSFARNTYTYSKWRANPGDLVTYFLVRDMRSQGLFQAVLSYDSGLKATHSMEGLVEEFYERDSEDSWEAILTITVTLVKEFEPDASKRILLQKQYRAAQKAEAKNPGAVAQAMSQAMSQVSAQAMQDIYGVLSRQEQ